MKAVRFHEFGGPEVLKYEDVREPLLRKDHVLIRVRACALNHLDLWIRRGLPGISLPHINGSDVAGEVLEVGEYVTDVSIGTRVLLAPHVFCGHCEACVSGRQNFCPQYSVLGARVDGGNAELISVPRVNVIPLPDSLSFEDAASVPLVFLTAWHMLVGRAQIKPGQTVLVLGAGSGVGSAAIQISKLFHCTVITTAGDDAKLAKAREIGADHVINRSQQKIADEVKRITSKQGVDIVFEHVGAATWQDSQKSLRPGGTIVTCGATTGADAGVNLNFLFSRQLSLLGSFMGTQGELYAVLKHVFSGALKPVIDSTFPLNEAAEAHRKMEKGDFFGKLVMVP